METLAPKSTDSMCRECRREIKPGWRSKKDPSLCLSCSTLQSIEQHGDPKTKCLRCGGMFDNIGDFCKPCTTENELQRRRNKLTEFLGGPEAVAMSLDNFEIEFGNKRAYEISTAFDPLKDNVYFFGNVGRGKSHLGYGIIQKFYLLGSECAIFTPRGLVNEFRGKDSPDQARMMERLFQMDVLLIDDLGITRATEFAIDILCELLDVRARAGKGGVIITSNLNLDDLKAKNGDDRLTSRIFGMSKIVPVDSLEDYRIKKGVKLQ